MRGRSCTVALAAIWLGCGGSTQSEGEATAPPPPATATTPLAEAIPVVCAPTPLEPRAERRAAPRRWLAITAPGLADAIAPLAEHRRQDGFTVLVSSAPPAEAIAATQPPPDYILLVGDELAPGSDAFSGAAQWRIASVWRDLYRWRAPQRKQFAADPAWGDRDGDLVPEIPVGRLPGRDAAAIAAMVKKIIDYETTAPTMTSLRLPIWAGAAGYNPQLDSMATTLLLGTLAAEGPRWARWEVLIADPLHPLTAWPPEQPARFTEMLAGGGAMAFLMGHGNTQVFHSMIHEGASIDYTVADASALASGVPAPPLVIFTCESGNFTATETSLAEALLALPGGPVATIGATTESHPLTNYFSGESLLVGLGDADRLGDLWLAAQRRARTAKNFLVENALAEAEGKLDEEIDTAKLRRDQMLMYALLGDPATRLRVPAPLEVSADAGDRICRWQATPPDGATTLHVDLWPAGREVAAAETAAADQASAMARYREADASFEPEPIAELAGGVPWRGEISRPGVLRLTAVGPGGLKVQTIEISPAE